MPHGATEHRHKKPIRNMEQHFYSAGELKQILKESANKMKFVPKVGENVAAENKRNSDKSCKDNEKAIREFDGGLKEEGKKDFPPREDMNATTLDYRPQGGVTKGYKERVDAEAKGYTTKMEKDNGIEKAAEFDDDGKVLKGIKDASEKKRSAKELLAKSGLQGYNLPYEKKETLYENNNNMAPKAKRLIFKHSTFLNESDMLRRIPEEYKVDGQKIFMKDKDDNEYVVECVKSDLSGLVETNISGYKNERLLKEEMDRIKHLFNYENENPFKPLTPQERIDESRSFKKMMDLARNMGK